ncbi:MAG: glycerol-3-phosphate responsive antiterminator [Rubrobacter sp.]|nr:glycerol-3-phosphate responsive antiterminator [Rubrobacter sp.]
MGKVVEKRMERFLGDLRRSPVVPTVRSDGKPLEEALAEEHPAILVLGGNIFDLTRRIGGGKRRTQIFVNVDLIGGIAGDKNGIGFLSEHVEGIVSTNRQVIERANSTDLITVQRLFAIDTTAMERGLKLVRRTKPRCVEILPALAYPRMASSYSELLDRPVLAGGFVTSEEELSRILDAGAVGVSTSHEALWKHTVDSGVKS